jgi:hypothetical protein
MKTIAFAGFGLALLLVGGCAPAGQPLGQPVGQPLAQGPHPDYGPRWTGSPAVASAYAPNGSTGYAPYSQDSYDTVVHDGSNGSGRQ